MENTDKRLFILAAALICLSIAWFAQFSQTQQHRTDANAVVQMLDALKTGDVGLTATVLTRK